MAVLGAPPFLQFFDDDGNPLSGGKIYTYAAGTTTPKATYTDAGGGTPADNPIDLDSSGIPDTSNGSMWLEAGGAYKFVVEDSLGNIIRTTDNVTAFSIVTSTSPSLLTLADAGADTTTWPILGLSQTGSTAPSTDSGLSYNASTNVLSVAGGINPNSSGGQTLSYYEEGTWTPTAGGTTVVGTQSYTTQFGQYTRVGRQVTATFRIVINGAWDGSSTGNLRVYGLPYAIKAGSNYRPALSNSGMANINITAANTPVAFGVQNSTSIQYFIQSVTTTGNFTVAMIGSGMDISGTIVYDV